MIARRILMTASAFALAVALTGCYEDPDVTVYEPGVYKGKDDPLLAKLEDPEFRAQLDQRFDGQRDR
jgi:hypothetical protein